MYEAMRQRAYHSSQVAGISATVLVLAITSYVVVTGLGARIVKAVLPPTIYVEVKDTPVEPKEPVEQTKLDTTVVLGEPPPPLDPLDDFRKRDEPPPIMPPPGGDRTETGAKVGPAPAPARKWPAMRTTEKPPYPIGPIRLKQEGVTGLSVCVGANGRVTSANLAYSSGFAALDEAALKWMRSVRFAPGTVDGVAQDMCGHKVSYEWTLEDASR